MITQHLSLKKAALVLRITPEILMEKCEMSVIRYHKTYYTGHIRISEADLKWVKKNWQNQNLYH